MPRYPFSPELLDALPEELAELFRSLEIQLLKDICSRLKLGGPLNEVTVQNIRALRAHGIDLKAIKEAIAENSGIGLDMVENLLDEVVAKNQAYYTETIDAAQLTAPQRLIDERDITAIRRQTWGAYKNITGSMGFLVVQGGRLTLLPPANAYQWALDNAEIKVQSGAVSYDQAIAEAVRELAASGLKTVSYESGHIDSVDVAVRRAVMTGINQLNQKYREQSMEYLETDLVEVTAHSGARDIDGPQGWENHKAWQGKVYRWRDKLRATKGDYPDFEDTCGLGSVTGIGGANCKHSYWPFIEGFSERTYTDEELEDIDPPPFEFEGRAYTAYQATQKQREIERTIRKQKRLKAAYKAAGLTDEANAVGAKLRRLNQKYREFCKAAGLPEEWERARMGFVDEASEKKAAERVEKQEEYDILKAPQENLTREGEIFNPETASKSLLKRLENSPGLPDNIAALRYYATTTKLEENTLMSASVGYSPRFDKIVYNPNHTLPAYTDRDGIFAHELAHRADVLGYQTDQRADWIEAIQSANEFISKNADVVQSWFSAGGKYEQNAFFSDIVNIVSNGTIDTPYSHRAEELAAPGVREQEVFANMVALDALLGMDSVPLEDGFKAIYEAFEKIIRGGFLL